MLPPLFEQIPEELRAIAVWMVWKSTYKGKVPFCARSLNEPASSTDPDTWSDFEAAQTAYEEGGYDGVGVALDGKGLAAVDLDHCVVNGEIRDDAIKFLEYIGACYAEYSPSGQGLRAFGLAQNLERGVNGEVHGLHIEMYTSGRYVTVTGHTIWNKGIKAFRNFREAAATVSRPKPKAENAETFPEGYRNQGLTSIAGSLRHIGLSFEAILSALFAVNEERCDPPLFDDEVEQIARSVSRYEPEGDVGIEAALGEQAAEDLTRDHTDYGFVWADTLKDEYEPIDEVVEGLIAAEQMTLIYGASNSGKTFWALYLAAAIASGEPFHGRRTDGGLVIYVAAEAPESVKKRVMAIKKFTGWNLENLAILPYPLDFHASDQSALGLIRAIKGVEGERGMKARAIFGDTMARMSPGANENSGEDMGPILKRMDMVVRETKASWVGIHHEGKDATRGARGWSGLRAHVDTEIQITHEKGARIAAVTKQRDLPSNGDQMGFKLEIVQMGVNKWGEPDTTCVAVPDQSVAPKKTRLEEHKEFFMAAWDWAGQNYDGQHPYISRSALKDYIRDALGRPNGKKGAEGADRAENVSERTVENKLRPSRKGELIAELTSNGIVEIQGNGYIIVDHALMAETSTRFW